MGYSTLGSYWKMLGMEFNPVFASSTITGIAANYDYVVASVVLRWAIHENVTVIPRSANPKHIGQNIRALDLSLLQEEYDLINGFDDWMKEEDLKTENEDLSKWSNNESKSSEDNTKPDEHLRRSKNDIVKSGDDVTAAKTDPTKPSEDLKQVRDISSNIVEDEISNKHLNEPARK